MALVKPTITHYNGAGDRSFYKAVWILTTADHTGIAVAVLEWPDKTWHCTGTLGAAAATIQGSALDVDGDFATLSDGASEALVVDTALPKCVFQGENPAFVRPKLTTVGSGATWVVTLTALRPTPMRT